MYFNTALYMHPEIVIRTNESINKKCNGGLDYRRTLGVQCKNVSRCCLILFFSSHESQLFFVELNYAQRIYSFMLLYILDTSI